MIKWIALGLLTMLTMVQARAQGADADVKNYPNRPIRILVPFPPGGPADLIARFVGQKSIQELIAKAKDNPGKMNMGAGTITSRLGAILFAKTAGIDAQLVPFKGSAEIGQAVLAGTVDFALDSTGTSLPLIQGGQYRALAKYSNRPLPILPDLPSLGAAADLPGLDESSTWVALAAPAGTPAAIVDKLQRKV